MYETVLAGQAWHDEVCNRAKSGQYYWVDTTIVPNFNTQNEIVGFTSIRTDITLQKQNIEHLHIAKQKAEQANIAKAHFLANMSHEIRTPMNGVYGSLQLLGNEALSVKGAKYLDNALVSVRSLMTIVDDIIDFPKIEAGKLVIEDTLFDLPELFNTVISDFSTLANNKQLSLNATNNIEHIEWRGDPVRIRQILVNIISNALKFTEKGNISVDMSYDAKAGDVIFVVKGTGIGMAPEAL